MGKKRVSRRGWCRGGKVERLREGGTEKWRRKEKISNAKEGKDTGIDT